MSWTTREKRHGGRQGIEARRLIEFKLIADALGKSPAKERAEMLKGVLEWLLENPVRTLPVLTKEYFGWV